MIQLAFCYPIYLEMIKAMAYNGPGVPRFLGNSFKIKIQSPAFLKFRLANTMNLGMGRVKVLPSIYFHFWLQHLIFPLRNQASLSHISEMWFEWSWLYTLHYLSGHVPQFWPLRAFFSVDLTDWLGNREMRPNTEPFVRAVRKEATSIC